MARVKLAAICALQNSLLCPSPSALGFVSFAVLAAELQLGPLAALALCSHHYEGHQMLCLQAWAALDGSSAQCWGQEMP